MKSIGKNAKNAAIRAAAVIIAAAFCLSVTGCKASRQRTNLHEGVELYNAGRLDEAKEKFILAGDYGAAVDFVQNIEECQRLLETADGMIDRREYEQARNILDALPLYDKANEKKLYLDALSAHYAEGVSLFESEKYPEAKNEFVLSHEYKNSAEYIAEIDRMNALYKQAKAYIASNDYINAILALRDIKASFVDTNALITECAEVLGAIPTDAKLYEHYYNDEFPDGAVELNIGEVASGFVVYDTVGFLFDAALDENKCIINLSIWISPGIAQEFDEEGLNAALSHCIHALNPYFMSLEELEANLESYLSDETLYGLYNVKKKVDSGGAIALNILAYKLAGKVLGNEFLFTEP